MRLIPIALLAVLLAACGAPAAQGPTPTPNSPAATLTPPTAPSVIPTAAPAPSPTALPAAAPAAIGYGQALGAAFIPGADRLAVGTSAGVLLLTLPDLKTAAFFSLEQAAREIAASPDGRFLAVSGYDGPTALTRVLTREGAEVLAVAGREPQFSRDGALLAVAELDNASGTYTNRIYNVGDWAELGAARGDRARLSPDGRVIASFDREDLVLTAIGGAELFRSPAYTVAFSPDSRTVAMSGFAGVELLTLAAGALDESSRRPLTPTPAQDLAFADDGTLLTVSQEGVLSWDLVAGGEPWPTRFELGADMGRFGPGGIMLALTTLVGDAPSTLRIIRADDMGGLYGESQFDGGEASFSPDGKRAAVVTDAGAVRLVDAERGVFMERRLPGYSRVAVRDDGSVAAGRWGPQVDFWPPEGGAIPSWSLGAFDYVESLRALTFTDAGLVAEVESVVFGGMVSRLRAVRFAPNAEEPVADALTVTDLSLELPASIWDSAAGRVAWAGPDGQILVSEAGGEPVALPALSGAPAGILPTSLAFSPDGLRLAVGFEEGTYLIVDVLELLPLGSGPSGAGEAITAIAWSADGMHIAYGLAGGGVLVGEALDDDPLRRIAGAPRTEYGGPRLALSADGGVLAVGAPAGIGVYRSVDGAEVMRLDARAEDVALSPDGRRLAAAVGGRIMTWPVAE